MCTQNALERCEDGNHEDADEEEVPLKARVLANLGVAHEAQNQLEEAIHAYQGAIQIHANYPAALKLLGCAYSPLFS